MKKNITTIVIMASSLINLILTIIIVFSLLSSINKSNTLISKIAGIIDLEVSADGSEEEEAYSIDDLELVPIPNFNEEQDRTITLKSTDDSLHVVKIGKFSVSVNKGADDSSSIITTLTEKPTFAWDALESVIGQYTIKEVNEKGRIGLQEEALTKIQEVYKTESIIGVNLESFIAQ